MLKDLSPEYLRRLLLPETRADLVPADAAGESGSVVGGGASRITLRFDSPHASPRRIRDARVRVLATAAPHGPAAVLLERLAGADERAAGTLSAHDLLAPLGPALPPSVPRAAQALLDSLHRALEDGAECARTDAPGVLVCRCLGVGDRVIRRAIRGGATDAPMIGIACAAGTGCHSCWPDLKSLLDEELHSPATSDRADANPVPESRTGPASALTTVARGLVAPLWRAQGLELRSLAIVGETVRVSVGRIAADALASPIGAVAIARHALREALSDTVRVELEAPPPG